MIRITVFMVAVIISQTAFGWGATGHRVTGRIAEDHLTKKAKKVLNELLEHQSLAMASTWMDEIKSDSSFDHTHDWHWVTIPDNMTYQQTEKNPNGDLIEALERIIVALKDRQLSREKEVQYLKMLIHLVGDIHQPLHVGRGDDQGGNSIKVSWFRRDSNLHRVWDSDMIDDTRLSYTELAASLDKPTTAEIKKWQSASIHEWAAESMSFRDAVYNIGNGKLSYPYPYKNFHIVRKRLLQAGVRLAGILNEIYG